MKEICMTKKQYKILVVDDNSSNAELLQEIFEKEQYRIYSYTNPLEALIAAENENYDILILDIVMPEMDGFQFAKHFTKIHPETPIVFISGYGNTEKNKVKSYDMGSYGYIEIKGKPFVGKTCLAKRALTLSVEKMFKAFYCMKTDLRYLQMVEQYLETVVSADSILFCFEDAAGFY